MMTGYGDWPGSGWVMWGFGGILLVGLVILLVWALSRGQRRDI
jgi:hypothetical protein